MSENEIQAFIIITGILGQLLVAKKSAWGFVAWIATNVAIIAVSAKQGLYGMVGLYAFYTAMCLYSIWSWTRSPKTADTNDVSAGLVCQEGAKG